MATNNGLDIKFYDDNVHLGVVGLEVKMTNSTATVYVTLPNGNTYSTEGITNIYSGLLNIPEITTSMPTGTYLFSVVDADADISSTTFVYSNPQPSLTYSSDLDCINSELTIKEGNTWNIEYNSETIIPTITSVTAAVTHVSGDTFNCGSALLFPGMTQSISPICSGAYNVNIQNWDLYYPINISPTTGTITTDTNIELYVSPDTSSQPIIVDCNNKLCSIECCLRSLYTKYKEAIERGNKSLESEYYDKTMRALQIARLAKRALLCGTSDLESYLDEVGEIMECQDCYNC